MLADAKIVTALIACFIYGLTILTRGRLSIQGRRFAWISLIGFCLILFSLLIVDKFIPSFHQFEK